MWGVIAIVSEMVGRSLDGMGLLWVIYGMRILDETVDEMMELLFRGMFRVIYYAAVKDDYCEAARRNGC